MDNVLGWPCVVSWLVMLVTIVLAKRGLSVKEAFTQPSVLLIMSLSAYTVIPGFILANTSSRAFSFIVPNEDYKDLGNVYSWGFLAFAYCHFMWSFKRTKRSTVSKVALTNDAHYIWIITCLILSTLVTAYYVSKVGFNILQTRDYANRTIQVGEGFFAFFKLLPYTCLSVLVFAYFRKFKPPVWLMVINTSVCFLYGVVFVERLLVLFTATIFLYFALTQNNRNLLIKISVGAIACFILFSAISTYRFTFDSSYKYSMAGKNLFEQVGDNLIFLDNITPVAAGYHIVSSETRFWGGDNYLVLVAQLVPGFLWEDKSGFIEYARVERHLGRIVSVGTQGASLTTTPWGEFLMCFGSNYFIAFAFIFSIVLEYLNKVALHISMKSIDSQFAFSAFLLTTIIYTRSTLLTICLNMIIFCLPAYLLFRLTYKIKVVFPVYEENAHTNSSQPYEKASLKPI